MANVPSMHKENSAIQFTTISYLSVQQSKLSPARCCGWPDELLPEAEGNSSLGHPQHRGGDNLAVAQKDLKYM